MELSELLATRNGHFLLESGHHGELWLDLPLLCIRPERIRPFAIDLADRLGKLDPEAICGPLIEGAFVAMMVAAELDVEFFYSERIERPADNSLYPVDYRISTALRGRIEGRRTVIINDVINAGSAVRGTAADLVGCQAQIVGVAALAVLGSWASGFCEENRIPLEAIESMPNSIWTKDRCPLCASGMPLENVGGFHEDR